MRTRRIGGCGVGPGRGRACYLDGAQRGPDGGPSAAEAGEGRAAAHRLLLRSRAVRVCVAARARAEPGPLRRHRAGAGAAQAGGSGSRPTDETPGSWRNLHRADLLTVVRAPTPAPTPAEEAGRDLCRARDDARVDPQRCRHRLGKLLLRRGLHYPGRAWTQAHRRWVNGLSWPHPAASGTSPVVRLGDRTRRRGQYGLVNTVSTIQFRLYS